MKHTAPESGLEAYTCPHCGVLAQQTHSLCMSHKWNQFNPAVIEFNKDAGEDYFFAME